LLEATLRNLLKISDAASLAIHAMALLSTRDAPVRVPLLAEALAASEAHLGKVMQRLGRAGLLNSVRGPKGGYQLAVPADQLMLLTILEVMDGPVPEVACLLKKPKCSDPCPCVLRSLSTKVNQLVREVFGSTSLSDVGICVDGWTTCASKSTG